jgi:ADP-dependent NAD(P)H-hydrate dehydratase / NAD(P)H-hydrate epimerase
MKLYTPFQIKAWDAYTIKHEPISSMNLMSRAAARFTERLEALIPTYSTPIDIVCGPGNNGGDGLMIARLLRLQAYDVCVFICTFDQPTSTDFDLALFELREIGDLDIVQMRPDNRISLRPGAYCIDALFGVGLNRQVAEPFSQIIHDLNGQPNPKIAVDVPSGLFADKPSLGPVIQASYTFTFERPKLSFFSPENHAFVGNWQIIPIDLHPHFDQTEPSLLHYQTSELATKTYHPRTRHEHKGSRGHAFLVAGSHGKIGAAVLAARACMRTGAGLATIHVPACGLDIIQMAIPEVMVSVDIGTHTIHHLPPYLDQYNAIGCGPGIGQSEQSIKALAHLLEAAAHVPLVLDADALNILALRNDLLAQLPPNTVLTPHPREFERLFGSTNHFFEMLELAKLKAQELGVILVLKGAYNPVVLPDGSIWFNSTGNPGMATGGSGDVLTGILTALLAQGYAPKDAALLGVYLHGLAGDLAAQKMGMDALIASDLIEHIGQAYLQLQ